MPKSSFYRDYLLHKRNIPFFRSGGSCNFPINEKFDRGTIPVIIGQNIPTTIGSLLIDMKNASIFYLFINNFNRLPGAI